MKIFTLESRKDLWIGSLLLAFFIVLVLFFWSKVVTSAPECPATGSVRCLSINNEPVQIDRGWPIKFNPYPNDEPTIVSEVILQQFSFIFDVMFWLVVIFLILNLTKYFKTKKA